MLFIWVSHIAWSQEKEPVRGMWYVKVTFHGNPQLLFAMTGLTNTNFISDDITSSFSAVFSCVMVVNSRNTSHLWLLSVYLLIWWMSTQTCIVYVFYESIKKIFFAQICANARQIQNYVKMLTMISQILTYQTRKIVLKLRSVDGRYIHMTAILHMQISNLCLLYM